MSDKPELTQEHIGEVLTGILKRADGSLLTMTAEEIAGLWYWRWKIDKSVEWNTYEFSDTLESHKRQWRRWEEHHNGTCCVVERVRDKYVMPRVREFLMTLAAHNNQGALSNE